MDFQQLNTHAGSVAQRRQQLQILAITLPETSRFLDSLLQLQTRIQLGLALEELFDLLDMHGLCPRWISAPAPEGVVSLTVELPEQAPQLLTCRTTRITVH
ncbi:hypothetical protein ACYCFK_09355 [Stutzerimonas stutzeri]